MSDSRPPRSQPVAALVVRRVIRASPERLFDAWTDSGQLAQWWGPEGVVCTQAEMDVRPGGSYRIANRLPDGSTLWISGVFEVVQRPSQLAFSWQVGGAHANIERVTVSFVSVAQGTEVIVTHERIADEKTRDGHALGWEGCLEGLSRFATQSGP
jgi:uncharacterized protein YndB with AHSA1/START domain